MIETLCLVKKDHINKINKKTEVFEEINDDKTKLLKFIMRLTITNYNDKEIYQLFCEENAKDNEHSRIKFLEVDRFPDGCFVVFNDTSIDCYICELKLTPTNKLKQLKEQLFSGYIHCKSLFSIMDIPIDITINYRFLVFLVNDKNIQVEYNRTNYKKIIPGEQIVPENDYDLWRRNKAIYRNGGYAFPMKLEKYQMNKAEDSIEYFYMYNM
nr:hypothetical protein [Fredinandcohnia onubensis]